MYFVNHYFSKDVKHYPEDDNIMFIFFGNRENNTPKKGKKANKRKRRKNKRNKK